MPKKQISLRLDPDIYKKLMAFAKKERRDRTNAAEYLISMGLKKVEKKG